MLKAEKISKKYGSQIVLDEASFEINSPEIKALIGINGSGKSISQNTGTVPNPSNLRYPQP